MKKVRNSQASLSQNRQFQFNWNSFNHLYMLMPFCDHHHYPYPWIDIQLLIAWLSQLNEMNGPCGVGFNTGK